MQYSKVEGGGEFDPRPLSVNFCFNQILEGRYVKVIRTIIYQTASRHPCPQCHIVVIFRHIMNEECSIK